MVAAILLFNSQRDLVHQVIIDNGFYLVFYLVVTNDFLGWQDLLELAQVTLLEFYGVCLDFQVAIQ